MSSASKDTTTALDSFVLPAAVSALDLAQLAGSAAALGLSWWAVSTSRKLYRAQSQPLLIDVPEGKYRESEEKIRFPDGTDIESPVEGQIIAAATEVADLSDTGERIGMRGEGRCSVPLRNVGAGVARVTANSLTVDAGLVTTGGPPSKPSVPQGEEVRFSYVVGTSADVWEQYRQAVHRGGPLYVDVEYEDFSGDLKLACRATMKQRRTESAWYVANVEPKRR